MMDQIAHDYLHQGKEQGIQQSQQITGSVGKAPATKVTTVTTGTLRKRFWSTTITLNKRKHMHAHSHACTQTQHHRMQHTHTHTHSHIHTQHISQLKNLRTSTVIVSR